MLSTLLHSSLHLVVHVHDFVSASSAVHYATWYVTPLKITIMFTECIFQEGQFSNGHKYVMNKAYQAAWCKSMTIYILPFMRDADVEELLFTQLHSQLHAKKNKKPEISIQTQKNNEWLNSLCQHDTTSNAPNSSLITLKVTFSQLAKFKNVPAWKSIFTKQQISVHIIQYLYFMTERGGFTWKKLTS